MQEIKYNKGIHKWEDLKRERKKISQINEKQWTDSFHDKAINTYYEFRKYGIEFADHGVARFLQHNIALNAVIGIDRKELTIFKMMEN